MDNYNLNDDVVKMMEEYFDIEYDNETKRFTTEDMLNFTIHAVIKLNKPAVSKCEGIERKPPCKHSDWVDLYGSVGDYYGRLCKDCNEWIDE